MRLVLVHGSVANGAGTWSAQAPLAERFELVVWNRPGYPPGPPLERDRLRRAGRRARRAAAARRPRRAGTRTAASISLLAAARADGLASLTVVEPPASRWPGTIRRSSTFVAQIEALWAAGPHSPEDYLRGFLPLVGSPFEVPDELPRALEQGTRAAMVERPPWEAEIPLDELAAAPFRKLVVSGGHNAALDAVCDVLERAARRRARGRGRRGALDPAPRRAVQPRARRLRRPDVRRRCGAAVGRAGSPSRRRA